MFTPINLYGNVHVINCNENLPARKHELDPVMNINLLLCLYNNLLKLPIYNNSIITTIALFTPTGDTDWIREYISDFSLSIGTNQHKSNMAPYSLLSLARQITFSASSQSQ
jgi:hypothetical protein